MERSEGARGAPVAPRLAPVPGAAEGFDPFTAMAPRFGRLARAFGRRFFQSFRFEPGDVERLRALEERGAVVYVMRYGSRLDYFLWNWLFLACDLRLSSFANGIRFYYYRPLPEAARLLARGIAGRLRRGYQGMRAMGLAHARAVLDARGSMFLFLRTDKIGSRLRPTRKGALATGRSETDFLEGVVSATFASGSPVFLVPLALFWSKGPRAQRRFLNLFYGAPERPTDTGKVISFLWNYRNLAVRVGEPIDLAAFVAERRAEGPARTARKVRRALMIFLRREEKPVAGAALRPLARVEELVLADPEVRRAIAAEVAAGGPAEDFVARRAQRCLREIAAAPSPVMLAALDVLVTRILGRLFERISVQGLERTVAAAKLHPLVLIPCHRSHIDYVILSWLFYENHLVPPLVAAGINLAFWPLGAIFRRAGAYFLRRTFEGDRLYATVFRAYVQQLLRDGATQEFFIEGTRSRTGRTLPPRLGMLGMVLGAYARGVRSDVQLVPIGFSYERVVEEASLTEERRGAGKARENLGALLSARRVLARRFGTVTIHFGEPLSLAAEVGPSRPLPGGPTHDDRERLRADTERLGGEIARRLSRLIAAGRTHVGAAALLASPAAGVLRSDFERRAREVVCVLRLAGAPLAEPLVADLDHDFADTLDFLAASGFVTRLPDRGGEILQTSAEARVLLDYYRNAIAAPLAPAAALALALAQERDDAPAAALEWLDLVRAEFFPPPREELDSLLERLLARFHALAPDARAGWLALFAAQLLPALQSYHALCSAVLDSDGTGERAAILGAARAALRRGVLLGSSLYPEAENPTALENALDRLIDERILETGAAPRARAARVHPGPRFEELESLTARLAGALGTR